jgi:tRNA-splicing ligase RtcB
MKKQVTNFAIDLEDGAQKQFEECLSHDFVTAGSLMPDAHKGYAAPIGSVLITKGKVVPAWVGYDIGCGMIAVKLKGALKENIEKHRKEIFSIVQKIVPMGMAEYNHINNISDETKEKFKILLDEFKKGEYDESVYKYLKDKALCQLGTLGSGNHFIELGYDENEDVYLVIHSGSRGIGHKELYL